VIADRLVHKGHAAELHVVTLDIGGGKQVDREIVEHKPVAVMVPVDADGNVVLVRQYRLPAKSVLLEVPAGGIDEGESPEEAAQRELREETGLQARRLTLLGEFYVSPGFLTEYMHVFLAEGLEEAHAEPDADEDIVVVRMPLAEAVGLAERGELRDAKTIAAILLAGRRLGVG
jgi:ADP-ribose pyrophosphatase